MDTNTKARGTREEVWAGRARRTAGGLTKDDLTMSKRGELVSKKQSEAAKLRYPTLKAKLCAQPAVPPALTDAELDDLLSPPKKHFKVVPIYIEEARAVKVVPRPVKVAGPSEDDVNKTARYLAGSFFPLGAAPTRDEKRAWSRKFNNLKFHLEALVSRGFSLEQAAGRLTPDDGVYGPFRG